MATNFARASVGYIVWFSVSLCMGGCYFANCGTHDMGMLVDCNTGPRYNWSGCNNGWYCFAVGVLFNYALVENTMAKLKYVYPFSFFTINTSIYVLSIWTGSLIFLDLKLLVKFPNLEFVIQLKYFIANLNILLNPDDNLVQGLIFSPLDSKSANLVVLPPTCKAASSRNMCIGMVKMLIFFKCGKKDVKCLHKAWGLGLTLDTKVLVLKAIDEIFAIYIFAFVQDVL